MKRVFTILAIVFGIASVSQAKDVYLIHLGWKTPDLRQLDENVAQYEADAPFDGLALHFGLDPFGPNPQEVDQFRNSIRLYKSIKFKQFKHNFLCTLIDQYEPRWFDDDAWKMIAKNWGVVAEVVARSGAEGVLFDSECYGTYPVSNYWNSKYYLKKDTRRTEKEYRAIARQRGRQMGKAMFSKNPNLVFWGLYLYSFKADLLAELCNGIMEEMPTTAKIVDGNEWSGYCANGRKAYETMERNVKDGFGMLANEASKKKSQLQLAPAFYLDAYARPTANGCIPAAANTDEKHRVRMFRENLREARSVSGGYIWIYGEKGTFWDLPKCTVKKWEEQLPGIGEVLFNNSRAASSSSTSPRAKPVGNWPPNLQKQIKERENRDSMPAN